MKTWKEFLSEETYEPKALIGAVLKSKLGLTSRDVSIKYNYTAAVTIRSRKAFNMYDKITSLLTNGRGSFTEVDERPDDIKDITIGIEVAEKLKDVLVASIEFEFKKLGGDNLETGAGGGRNMVKLFGSISVRLGTDGTYSVGTKYHDISREYVAAAVLRLMIRTVNDRTLAAI